MELGVDNNFYLDKVVDQTQQSETYPWYEKFAGYYQVYFTSAMLEIYLCFEKT